MKIILDFMDYRNRPLLLASIQERVIWAKHSDYSLWLPFGPLERDDNFANVLQTIADEHCPPESEIVFLYECGLEEGWQNDFYAAVTRALRDFGRYMFHFEGNTVLE